MSRTEDSTQGSDNGGNTSDNQPTQNPALKVTTETMPTKIEHSDKSGREYRGDTE